MAAIPFSPSSTSGANTSYWVESKEALPRFHSLDRNQKTDVVIVGAGISGITIAYCLLNEDYKVIVVDDGYVGSGETGRTTAHLVTALDDRYFHLEKIWGVEDTRLIAESHRAAIDFVEQTIQQEKIDCSFERLSGYLMLHPTDKQESLTKEMDSASKAGLDVQLLDHVPGIQYPGSCIEFANQAQFHPLLYLNGLCKSIISKGGKIYTNTHARKIDHEGIETENGFTVTADYVVVATNSPVNNLVAMHLKQTAIRTYVIGALVKRSALPKALWWDTGDHKQDSAFPPYHYVRLQSYDDAYDLLISGGEDHATGDTEDGVKEEDRYIALEEWTRTYFPIEDVIYKWSGQVLEPVDSIAFIGRNPMDKDNVFIVTGDSGNGMTHGTLSGLLITDLIKGRQSPYEHLYKPSRITFETGGVFFKELIRGLVAAIEGSEEDDRVHDISQIQKGEGKITKWQGHRCGVYKDENGELHIISPRCTHLKATLNWNDDEKTWDCPWHGSRFSVDGEVLNGPAISSLASYSKEGERITDETKDITITNKNQVASN